MAYRNPFRYRGYYYDTNLGMYYLQSRFYNPEWGRFLNGDGQLNPYLLGHNMFAYCSNCPVILFDPTGCSNEKVSAESIYNLSPTQFSELIRLINKELNVTDSKKSTIKKINNIIAILAESKITKAFPKISALFTAINIVSALYSDNVRNYMSRIEDEMHAIYNKYSSSSKYKYEIRLLNSFVGYQMKITVKYNNKKSSNVYSRTWLFRYTECYTIIFDNLEAMKIKYAVKWRDAFYEY